MSTHFIRNRYFAEGIWTAESAVHIGSERDDRLQTVDMLILRDPSGAFYVPGTSLAGAARAHMRIAGDMGSVSRLFGAERDKGYASALIAFDAYARAAKPVVRDGVRIDPHTRTAFKGAKFDWEALPAGTAFALRFELVDYGDDAALRADFLRMLAAFAQGHIQLGARTRRGCGAGRAVWSSIRRLDMSDARHALAWLKRDWSVGEALALPTEAAPRAAFRIEAKLRLATSVLVRSANEQPGAADVSHLFENGNGVVPGTSLAGVLRHRAARIAGTLGLHEGSNIVESLFGRALVDSKDRRPLRGSRVRISEGTLEHVARHVQGRVRLDRFTGGARDTALFSEGAAWPEQNDGPASDYHLPLRLELHDLRPGEAELLLLVFKDLWLGDLPIGGGSSGGRGVFEGISATITMPNGEQASWKRRVDPSTQRLSEPSVLERDGDCLDRLFDAWPQSAEGWSKSEEELRDDAPART